MLRLVCIFGLLNLLWEIVQLPFYTLWSIGTPGEIAYAVLHCTGGDILIGAVAAVIASAAVRWLKPAPHGSWRFLAVFVPLALAYTVFSEWLNVSVLNSWAYADIMPRVPGLGTGLTPVLQWIIVPLLTWTAAGESIRARLAGRPGREEGSPL